jgi:transposase-like protein
MHSKAEAEADAGRRPGVTSEEAAEIKRLKAENDELRRANEILGLVGWPKDMRLMVRKERPRAGG